METMRVLVMIATLALSVSTSYAGTESAAAAPSKPTSSAGNPIYTTYEPGLEPTDPAVLKERRLAWANMLSGVSSIEGATMFAEIDMSKDPPDGLVLKRPIGSLGMRVLARALRENWVQVVGVQVFNEGPVMPPPPNYGESFIGILDTLTADQWRAALGDGVAVDHLSEANATSLITAVAGGYPYLSEGLLDHPDSYKLRIEFLPCVNWDNGTPRRFYIPLKTTPVPAYSPGTGAPAPFRIPFLPLQSASAGPLSFGNGEVLRLRDILAKAEGVFQTRYDVDLRLYRTWYFVRGSFTKESFQMAAKAATNVASIHEHRPGRSEFQEEIASLLNGPASGLLEHKLEYGHESDSAVSDLGVSPTDFLAGGVVPVSRIAAGSPQILDGLRGVGLAPDTLVTLQAGLFFDVDGGGFIPVTSGGGTYNLRNQFKLVIR